VTPGVTSKVKSRQSSSVNRLLSCRFKAGWNSFVTSGLTPLVTLNLTLDLNLGLIFALNLNLSLALTLSLNLGLNLDLSLTLTRRFHSHVPL